MGVYPYVHRFFTQANIVLLLAYLLFFEQQQLSGLLCCHVNIY
jgi:hypothetical protein